MARTSFAYEERMRTSEQIKYMVLYIYIKKTTFYLHLSRCLDTHNKYESRNSGDCTLVNMTASQVIIENELNSYHSKKRFFPNNGLVQQRFRKNECTSIFFNMQKHLEQTVKFETELN